MTDRLSPLVSRALAIVLLLAALGTLYAVIANPLVARYEDRREFDLPKGNPARALPARRGGSRCPPGPA